MTECTCKDCGAKFQAELSFCDCCDDCYATAQKKAADACEKYRKENFEYFTEGESIA